MKRIIKKQLKKKIMTKELRNFLIISGSLFIVMLLANIAFNRIADLKKELAIANMNTSTLLQEKNEVVGKNGELIIGIQALILDKTELELGNAELSKKLKDMGINYNKVSSAAQVLATENTRLKLALKDSVRVKVVKDTLRIDTLRCFSKADKYNLVSGCIDGDSIDLNIQTKVPLTIVMTNVYKHKFLWWRWGVINKKLEVSSDNKNVTFPNVKLYIPK